jgi:hypothetical protein
VRLADAVFRQGHLAERALVDVWMTGNRPAHLDRCELCADRADEMAKWLDDLRVAGTEAADAVFPAERLAAQQAQILSRIEQLDRPSRVLAFPRALRADHAAPMRAGLRPVWFGAAVAAGLLLGGVTTHYGSRLMQRDSANTRQVQVAGLVPAAFTADDAALFEAQLDRITPESLRTIEELTPHASEVILANVKR